MISIEQVDGNTGIMEAAHLTDKKQAGLVVAPIAIIEITRDNEEGNLILDGKFNKLIKSLTRGRADVRRRSSLMPGKPSQRTVQMNIRSVKEAKQSHNIMLRGVG